MEIQSASTPIPSIKPIIDSSSTAIYGSQATTKVLGKVVATAAADASQAVQTENKINRENPASPTANPPKTAQTINDSVVASGKTLAQVVMENDPSTKTKLMETRDLGVSSITSDMGTAVNKNAIPAEINSKPKA